MKKIPTQTYVEAHAIQYCIQLFNAVEVSQIRLLLAQRVGAGHDRTLQGTRRRALVAHRTCSIREKKGNVEFVSNRAHKDENSKKERPKLGEKGGNNGNECQESERHENNGKER